MHSFILYHRGGLSAYTTSKMIYILISNHGLSLYKKATNRSYWLLSNICSHALHSQTQSINPLTFAAIFSYASQQRTLPGLFPSFLKQLFPTALNWCTCGVLIPAFSSDTLDFTGSPGFYRIVPWHTKSIRTIIISPF